MFEIDMKIMCRIASSQFDISLTEILTCQVRMKAVCVLESIVRKKDDEPFSIIASYYGENRDVLIGCAESPQASLRDKTNRVSISRINV